MELKVKIELTYAEAYCGHCGHTIYTDGEFDGNKPSVNRDMGKNEMDSVLKCENCGEENKWKTMIQYGIVR